MNESKQLPVCLDKVQENHSKEATYRQKVVFGSNDFAVGSSILLREVAELFSICLMIPLLGEPQDINHFKQKITEMIVTFQRRIADSYRQEDVQRLSLFLCCLFDELVMNSHWQGVIYWSNQTLSSTLFKRRDSGHYLLEVIKSWIDDPDSNRDALRFSYVAFYLGFQGEWRFKDPQMRRIMMSLLDEKVRLKEDSDDYHFEGIKVVAGKKIHLIRMKKIIFYGLFFSLIINLSGFLWALSYQSTSIDALMEVRVDKNQINPPYTPASPKEAVEVLFSSPTLVFPGLWQ